MFRDSDVIALIKSVMEMELEYNYNDCHWDEYCCPFCCESKQAKKEYTMDNFPHDTGCGYLIAKDLSTHTESAQSVKKPD